MIKFVGICVALFLLAVGLVVFTQGHDLAGLFNAFSAEPLIDKLAWAVIVVVPLVLLPIAVWLCDTLVRQRKASNALELRLGGVRQGVSELAKSQVDADAAVHHLARTDPESAMGAVQHRLTEAEHVAQVQQNRNEIGDLQTRIDDIGARQRGLKERLAPVLDKRRSIERLFIELDTGQHDIERVLAEIGGGDDAVALDLRLRKLLEFISLAHGRCDEIEDAAKTIAGLQKDYSGLRARVAPLASAEKGVARRVKDLSVSKDTLAADIDSLQHTPQGTLTERVRGFADNKQKLSDALSGLNAEFSKLATLRKDIDVLSENLNRTLDLFLPDDKDSAVDVRVDELSTFIAATHAQFEDVERRMVLFSQLRAKLGELQSRLVPLEAAEGGVVSRIEQVQDIHDKLVAKIQRLEEGDGGDLAGRVKTFAEARQELELRVSAVTEHFSQLATIRKDIAGLFEKLNSTVNGSSN